MLRDLTLKKAFETPAKCLNSGCICCIGCLGFAEKGLLTEHREHITRHLSQYSCLNADWRHTGGKYSTQDCRSFQSPLDESKSHLKGDLCTCTFESFESFDHLWSPLHLSRYPGYPGLSSQQRPLSWYSILGVDWELSNKYLITKPTSNDQCQITSGKPYDLYDSYDSYDTDFVRLISVWCTSPRIPVQLDDSTQATLHCSREETDTTVK